MTAVERLDFSKPPPGFNLDDLPRHLTMTVRTAGVWGPNVLAAAWAHCKARHDPPGLQVDWDSVTGWGFTIANAHRVHVTPGPADDGLQGRVGPAKADARAAAWKVYEDALEVADLLDGENGPAESWPDDFSWPQPLTWTSERRAKVRTLCLNGGDWSEVLSG